MVSQYLQHFNDTAEMIGKSSYISFNLDTAFENSHLVAETHLHLNVLTSNVISQTFKSKMDKNR